MKQRLFFLTFLGTLTTFALTVTPLPQGGSPELLLKPGNTQDLTFPAFTEKVVLTVTPEKPSYLRKLILTANAAPSANFESALVEVRTGQDWTPVDLLHPPTEQVKTLYRVAGRELSAKAEEVRITMTPPFIESAMTLRGIQLEFSDTPSKAAVSKGGIVIGGQNTPGYLGRPLGMADGEKLSLTAGFELPVGKDFECNILVQKENTATAARIVLRGKGDDREIGYYAQSEYRKLFPVSGSQAELTLECDNAARRFTLLVNGAKSEVLPFNVGLPGIDMVMMSVPAASDGVQLQLFRYTLTGKSGTRATADVNLTDSAEFDRFKRSGRIQQIEPQSDAIRPPTADLLTIESEGKRYMFSRKNGELFGIADLKSGRILVDSLRTLYSVQVLERDSNADGFYDRVKEVKQEENEIIFRCAASFDPALVIEKHYRFAVSELSKEIRFHASGKKFRFVTPSERLIFPVERRSKLILSGSDPWYSPRVRLADVKLPTRQSGSGVSHAVAAFEADGRDSVALLRYRVNDRFSWPVHCAYIYEPSNVLIYYPDGIRLPAATLPLHGSEVVSYESKLLFFSGHEMEYLASYRALPDVVQAYGEIKRPAWMADVLAQIWVRPEFTGNAVKQVRQLLAMTERGDIMVVLNQPFIWGDFGEKERFRNIWGAWTKDTEYIELIKELKALSPRIKVALYTWLWTIAPDSDFYREFPSAAISRNRRGQIFNSYPGVELSFQRRLSDSAGLAKLTEQYDAMVKKYGIDYVYLDGGHGGAPLIDWKHGTVDQGYQWQNFYCYMRGLAEKYGKGGVSFNFKSNPIADSGIAEMALDAFRNNPALVGARIWGGKLQEKLDPDHRVIPCYWGRSDPYYTNICLGLGLLPHIECAGLSAVEPDFITIKSPFLGAMREMFRTVPVRIVPGSMLENPASKVLGFELARGGSTLYSLIPSGNPGKPFPLPAAKEFLWRNDLINPVGFKEIFTEKQQMEAWRMHGWRLSRTVNHHLMGKENTIPLRENLLSVVSASDSGAVILAVDELPTQMWLPTLPGIAVETAYGADQVTGKNTSRKKLDIAIALPEGKELGALENAEFRGLFRENGRAFAILRIGGNFKAGLKPAEKREFALQLPARISPGDTVRIPGMPFGAAFSLYSDSQLVMSTASTEFTIPELARAGRYAWKVENAVGTLAAADVEITGTKEVPLPRIPLIVRPAATRTPVEHAAVAAVVLGGGQEENADLETLTLTAKLKERPETQWNYSAAGFEFKNVRYLRFDAASDIATRYCIERRKSWAPAFAGILIDYKVGGVFVKRVALDLGMTEYTWKTPEYGTGRAPDQQVKLGNWIQKEAEEKVLLDLTRYAPTNWNGECIVSALVANVLQGRKLTLKLEAFSATDAGILTGETAMAEAANELAPFPEPVTVPGEITDFREPVNLKPALPATRLAIRREGKKARFDFVCSEPDFDTIIPQSGEWVHSADSVELYFYDPASKKLMRVAANAAGDLDAGKLRDVKVSTRMVPEKKEFHISFEIPLSQLPPGDKMRMNACRNRPRRNDEPASRWTSAAWARLKVERYATPEAFGTVCWRKLPPITIINAGISGNNTADLLTRLERDVLSRKPDTVILLAGTNDMLNSGNALSLKKAIDNLGKLVDRIQSANAKVILMTIPPCYTPYVLKRHPQSFFGNQTPQEKVDLYNQAVRRLAESKGVILVDVAQNFETNGQIGENVASYLRNPANGRTEDGVHPVAAGYRAIAQQLFDTFQCHQLRPVRLVCFGDSITLGIGGANPGRMDGENYPAYLNQLFNR